MSPLVVAPSGGLAAYAANLTFRMRALKRPWWTRCNRGGFLSSYRAIACKPIITALAAARLSDQRTPES